MQFLARHGLHGILADDMGLGKTLQTLTHILTEKKSGHSQGKPTLVVAPTSVVPNWRAEALKFTPDLRVLVLNGPERKKYHRSIPHADLVLTSFALLHRDIEKLRAHPFHMVVLDEAQNIKNPRAKVAQAACKLDARHRLCLSGTPVENHLGELWSLMKFLVPGFLGSEEAFNTRFRKPIENDGDEDRNELLKQRVAPLILRRTKDQVAKELPPKTELVHLIELHTAQKDLYETVRATMNKRVREAIAARGGSDLQIVFLDALLKLRQICCDPRLLPAEFSNDIHESAKLDFLTDCSTVLIEEGRRILIFSQFTTMLALIEAHLVREKIPYLKLTGASKDRGKLVEDFQTGKIPRLPHLPQSRRHRPQPHRRRHRHPLRPLVEPRRRGPGHRPRLPHRPGQTRSSSTNSSARTPSRNASTSSNRTKPNSPPASSPTPTSPTNSTPPWSGRCWRSEFGQCMNRRSRLTLFALTKNKISPLILT